MSDVCVLFNTNNSFDNILSIKTKKQYWYIIQGCKSPWSKNPKMLKKILKKEEPFYCFVQRFFLQKKSWNQDFSWKLTSLITYIAQEIFSTQTLIGELDISGKITKISDLKNILYNAISQNESIVAKLELFGFLYRYY